MAANEEIQMTVDREAAARDLLAEMSRLVAASPLLAGSVVDAETAIIRLTNGSTIRSVPASSKQIRGQSVDVLVLDEACFIEDAIWQAARFTTIARPRSQVVMASTPWGRRDRFFALSWRAGKRHEPGYASFHWPSSVSPLVDRDLLDIWRASSTEREYEAEVEARWVDEAGAYFRAVDLEAAVAGYELVAPAAAGRMAAVGGIDWGFVRDSSALVLLAAADGQEWAAGWPARSFWLPWLTEAQGLAYGAFIARIVDAARGYRLSRLMSETNGVGAMPTQELSRLAAGLVGRVVPVATSAESKEDGFGKIRLLLEQHRLALPRHPRLLGQLAALEFEERESGRVRIAVPERAGHDDLAMALCLAVGGSDVASVAQRASLASAAGRRIPVSPVPRAAPDAAFSGGTGRGHVSSGVVPRRSRQMRLLRAQGFRALAPGAYRPPEEDR